MSTTVVNQSNEVVATRMFGGRAVGVVVQMEVTATEWAAWQGVMVAEEGSTKFVRFADWVAAQNATVVWDNAARQNEVARAMADSRFAVQDTDVADMFRAAADSARARARDCARQSFAVAA